MPSGAADRRSQSLAQQHPFRIHPQLERAGILLHPQLQRYQQETGFNRGAMRMLPAVQRVYPLVHTMLVHHKNSSANISEDSAIDAFNDGVRRREFKEELGHV